VTPLSRAMRLRYVAGTPARRVSWLELFFDLIFVAAVAQVSAPLREDYAVSGIVRFATLFILIWWAWTGHSVFSTRFDTDDSVQRALTFVQMFAVAVMAANAQHPLGSRDSAGFAAAYAIVRLVLVVQYVRARSVHQARALATRYLVGHGIAATLWLASAFTMAPARFAIWAAAMAIDLGTPWLALSHSVRVPPDAAHLPERFGLFTLILLGETVVAIMEGMESQEHWSVVAASAALVSMAAAFVVWWWYFDVVGAAQERPVRSRSEAVRLHLWSYAHLPLYLGIAVGGVGLQRIVRTAERSGPGAAELAIVFTAFVLVATAMGSLMRMRVEA
jgi:low temperature requirement protein LtrA